MIALEEVSRRYGAHPAVQRLTLSRAAGEFFSLVGASGCGKTTTLRPLLAPELLAAALLSFSLSFDDDVISSFTAGATVTLPLYLAGAFQREISPQIQVLSTLVLLVSAALLAIGLRRPPHPRQEQPSPAPGKEWPGSLPPEPTSSPPFPPP